MRDIRAMLTSARCEARCKRTGLKCQAPAVRDKAVCRMHGAFAGAPSGRRNGAYRHGHFTFEALVERARQRLRLASFRRTLNDLEADLGSD
jgi:hypothetical protein